MYSVVKTLVAAQQCPTYEHCVSSLPQPYTDVFRPCLTMDFAFGRPRKKLKSMREGLTEAIEALGDQGLAEQPLPPEDTAKAMLQVTASVLREHGYEQNLLVIFDEAVREVEAAATAPDNETE